MSDGPYAGISYVIEPVREFDDPFRGRMLEADFLDKRGYWDTGYFRMDQIATWEDELSGICGKP